MKNHPFHLPLFLFVLTLCLSACAGAPTAPAAEAQPAQEAAAPAQAPEPTLAPAPTAAPPVPCMIAFDSDRDGNREVYLMGPDGKDPLNLSNNPADDTDPAWSPNGDQIAFVSNRDNGKGGGLFIYVMSADGADVRQLSMESPSSFPDWSPDGSRVTYTVNDDIYVMNADGSGQVVNLTNSPEKDWRSSWSPDSSQLVWLSGSGDSWNIIVMGADGSNVRQLTNDGKVTDVAWTVDGQLFTHWDNQEAGCFNCVMDADGANIIPAGGKGEIQKYLPFWTREGERVECISGDLNGGDNEIYLVSDIYPDIFLNLTNNPADDRNPDWPAACGPAGATPQAAAVPPSEPAAPQQQPKSPQDLVIGYAGDDQWQQQRKQDFQQACDELGIRCVYGDLPALLEQGVDAVVHNADTNTVPGLHNDILSARDQGVPVFLLDAETLTDGAYSITVDNREWVRTGLEWIIKQMNGQGELAFVDLKGAYGHETFINEVLAENPGVSLVDQISGKYDQSKLEADAAEILKSHPNLKGFWSNERTVSVQWAVKGFKPEAWPQVICEASKEGLFAWTEMLKENPAFDCLAVLNPPGVAYDAVYAAYYLLTGSQINPSALGGEYGRSLLVDIPLVTSDTLQDWLEKTQAQDEKFLLDEFMQPERIKEKWFIE